MILKVLHLRVKPMKLLRTTGAAMLVAMAVGAQTAPPPDQIRGEITNVNAQAKQIAVKTDKGEAVTVTTTDRTVVVRMPAGVTDPKQGVKIELSAITPNDKLIAIGKLSADKKSLEGARLYVLTVSDIAQIHKQEDEDWVKRGTSGEVTAVDAAAKTITIKSGSKEITIESSDKADFRRYSADSFKSTDAKPSSLAEIKTGDQVRVLGNKNAEGDKVAAERIFSGTFPPHFGNHRLHRSGSQRAQGEGSGDQKIADDQAGSGFAGEETGA